MPPVALANALTALAAPLCGMIAALAGIDEVDADDSAREGAETETISRRYERRPVNREICIVLKGRRCWCCNLDFGLVYGDEAEGFIEVHHKVPVSGMGPDYRVHPVRDLFPVCSNCHSVIHLSRPPEDPDDLRARLKLAGP
jgi:5-methylcytosine-specific restriction protein A